MSHMNKRMTVKVGSLYTSKYYAESKDLYFRLRAKRIDQTFDPEAKYRRVSQKFVVNLPLGDSAVD